MKRICLSLILFFFLLCACGRESSHKSRYYVKPRKDYSLDDPRFDPLDEIDPQLRVEIAEFLCEYVDSYNEIDFPDGAEGIPIDDLKIRGTDHMEYIEETIMPYAADDKYSNLVLPSIEAYLAFGNLLFNNEWSMSIGGTEDTSNNILIVSPDEWMEIHDKIVEALEYYYGE